VAVTIGSGAGEFTVRIFGPHTIAGEQGFVLGMPRSANLKVEEAARVWVLERPTYDHLLDSEAQLIVSLLRDIVRLQAERLAYSTREAAALAT
jgi:CRP-like cAMP-binding protein